MATTTSAITEVPLGWAPFQLEQVEYRLQGSDRVLDYEGLVAALALRYEDIDRAKNQIHVTKSVYYISTTPYIKEPKTEAGIRTVFLLPEVAERFTGVEGYIFTNEKGEILRSNESSRDWRKWCGKYGIECTFHQLRHSFATTCCEAGIEQRVVQGMMGHSSYIVTEKYTHLRDKMLAEARERFEKNQ